MTSTAALILAAIGTVGCVSLGDDLNEVSLWEAQLTPDAGHPDLAGQAAAFSRSDGTSVGISIEGAEPGAAHAWGLRLGSCADPRQQIGSDTDYPALSVIDAGTAETETHLGLQLSVTGSYHVDVRVSAAEPSRVACGDLVMIDRDSLYASGGLM